jgi:hypothetical protein
MIAELVIHQNFHADVIVLYTTEPKVIMAWCHKGVISTGMSRGLG